MEDKPKGILILVLMQLLVALIWLILGISAVVDAVSAGFFGIFQMWEGLLTIIIGIVGCIIDFGLYSQRKWARLCAIITNILGVLIGWGNLGSLFSIIGITLSLVVILWLFIPEMKSNFGKQIDSVDW